MDVTAYTYGGAGKVELGGIVDSIWTNGFKSSEKRVIQFARYFRAPAEIPLDRVTRLQNFSFAAGRSFALVADALNFLQTHPPTVPAVADIQFAQQGGEAWLLRTGIEDVDLIRKDGALIIFGYAIKGGVWAKKRN
jgi:hypothetical protein